MRNPRILVLDRTGPFAAQVEQVAVDMRPRPEVVVCERLGSVDDRLCDEGPFDVLVAGPSLATKSGLARVERVRREMPAMTIVMAFSNRPDASLREIIRVGAVDLLHLPLEDAALRSSLEQAVELSLARPGRAGSPEAAEARPPSEPARVYTVASPTGGSGKTFVAVNLAYFLYRNTAMRTCLVDLDLQFGELRTALRLKTPLTIFDVAKAAGSDAELRDRIEDYVVAHESGVHLLAAPRDPSQADDIHLSDVARILTALRARFDHVVVDTVHALAETALAAFDVSDHVCVPTTLDLPSIRRLAVFVSTLEKLKIPSERISLIVNKLERDTGIDLDEAAELFPRGFSAALPYAREVTRSLNLGTPVLAYAPSAEISRTLLAGLQSLLSGAGRAASGTDAGSAAPGRRSWLSRRLRPSGVVARAGSVR